MKQKYDITGMTCSACSAHVDKSVRMIRGVGEVNVNLLKNSMVVEYDESLTNDDAIIAAVVSGGYGAAVAGQKTVATKKTDEEEAKAEVKAETNTFGDIEYAVSKGLKEETRKITIIY